MDVQWGGRQLSEKEGLLFAVFEARLYGHQLDQLAERFDTNPPSE